MSECSSAAKWRSQRQRLRYIPMTLLLVLLTSCIQPNQAVTHSSRTFIGVKNPHKDQTYGSGLLFVSPAASQSEAEQILQQFGAERVAMLDGGQSTGLIVGGKTIMQPKTRIPQTIGIFTK
jgi:hypothetical protein